MRPVSKTVSWSGRMFILLSFLSPSVGLTQKSENPNLLCQSELLKRDVKGDWADAIFFPNESFEITRLADNKASVNKKYLSVELRCEVHSTRIDCTHQPSPMSMRISINRLTGIYESDISSSDGVKSKVRGRCALSSRLLF